ncbi:flavin reductase family protein [Microbacterium amylolyticum]|uniref:Flavin reductase (DIM6/NTAB) family NADH-FMN oxidoreductase RutF n=1 Tax=Microbacterium amylolyticum TaxID=936337 RepID=A0ABS4ZFJ1_9MICO|nr:flavin reductase family protein [Microbacterium amylolyticum]MBP2436040.1 flavin reductase (DIM6/NTAB) family NADH-FMN oxidoreductase RutF [Microbacterium amylolyticum]
MQHAPLGDLFKAVFRDHPAAVTVITAITADGPVGLTASSVASVAVDPPALSFSVTRSTGSAGGLLGAERLQVHFVTPEHAGVAMSFARSGDERFTPEQGWSFDADGSPRLDGARARVAGKIAGTIPVGSSMLVVLEVDEIDDGEPGEPLVFADRTFRRLGGIVSM